MYKRMKEKKEISKKISPFFTKIFKVICIKHLKKIKIRKYIDNN